MHDRGEKLDPQRLSGLWKVIFDHEAHSQGKDCHSMKLKSYVAGLNETQLQLFTGYWNKTEDKFFYDNDAYLTFNHPERSN